MDDELIDRIYECGFVPELWPQVLRDTSKISDSAGASMFVTNPGVVAWTASKNTRATAEQFIKDGWYWRGSMMSRIHNSRHAGFLREIDLFTPGEIEQEPIFRDNWRRIGLGWGAATAFPLQTGETLAIVLSRAIAQGPADAETIQKLDLLRPHFARAAVLAARLHLERVRAASDALAALGLAAMVLDEAGKVIAANALMEALPNLVHWRPADRVTLKDRRADELLGEAVARIGFADNSGVRSFPVRVAEDGALMVGHLLPIRFSARDIFAHSAAVFVLMPVAAPNAPSAELVMSLFDLTPAEARVARGLVAGKTVDALAQDNGVSANTVRVQVRGVLEKTGCQRQTDMVALLGGLSPVRGASPQQSPGPRYSSAPISGEVNPNGIGRGEPAA